MLLVKKMHRTAEAARTTGVLAKKLGHAGIGAGAAGEGVGVIAISGDDVIIEAGGGDGAGDNRFLPDIKMTKTADLLRLILLAGAFLEAPDEQHQPEHLDFVALLGRLHQDQVARATRTVLRGASARINRTKMAVKARSLRSELRKNIQVGVAAYCGSPTVSAWSKPAKFFT